MILVLYQPDIPQNTGNILRLGACFGIPVHIVEPAGFDLSDRRLKRAGMDYLGSVALVRHLSFAAFETWRKNSGIRLLLLTTSGDRPYTDVAFRADDAILLGRESSGVPADVHAAADARIVIPLVPGLRSLNIASAAAMVLGEALRQTIWTRPK